jgi:hypothetical protein
LLAHHKYVIVLPYRVMQCWSLPEATDEPAIEVVMIASHGTQGYSFVSPARRLTRP